MSGRERPIRTMRTHGCGGRRWAHREQSVVPLDQPLEHADDGDALLRAGQTLHRKLLVRVLGFVQEVRPEDGGEVPRRHLVAGELQSEQIQKADNAVVRRSFDTGY